VGSGRFSAPYSNYIGVMKMKKINCLKKLSPQNEGGLAFWLTAPTFGYLLLVMLVPFCWAIYISLTDKKIGTDAHFIWLGNYWELITDSLFLKALLNTIIFTVFAVIFKVVFGMIMALVLNEDIKARSFFRALLILPWTIPTLVSVYTWQWLYSDVGGALNYILLYLGIIKQQVGWLSTPLMAMISVIIVNVWRGTPFLGISVLAGLQTVDEGLYEAAKIDGANMFQQFWHITMASVKNIVILSSIITTIWTLSDFEIIWLLTRGGPANGTQVISTLSYTCGFLNLDLSKAIAISIFIFPLLILLVHYTTKKTLDLEV
jgi:multiple sugar transport system permease protein